MLPIAFFKHPSPLTAPNEPSPARRTNPAPRAERTQFQEGRLPERTEHSFLPAPNEPSFKEGRLPERRVIPLGRGTQPQENGQPGRDGRESRVIIRASAMSRRDFQR